MKEPIDYLKNSTAMKQQPCSEKKCVTCFENRGCMYEQYLIAVIDNVEASYPANRINAATQQYK